MSRRFMQGNYPEGLTVVNGRCGAGIDNTFRFAVVFSMKNSIVRMLVLLFVVGMVFYACGGESSSYAGTWVSVEHYLSGERDASLEGKTIEFNKDGTATTAIGKGTWVVEEDAIVFTKEGNADPDITYTINGDTLIVETFIVKIVYEKQE